MPEWPAVWTTWSAEAGRTLWSSQALCTGQTTSYLLSEEISLGSTGLAWLSWSLTFRGR
jgi:hypothetical protein